MKIEKREKNVVVTETVYVSNDGVEFTNEAECKKWEDCSDKIFIRGWKDMDKVEMSAIRTGIEYNTEDQYAYLVKPKSESDIKILNEMNDISYGSRALGLNDIGKYKLVIISVFGYDKDKCNFYDSDYVFMMDVSEVITDILSAYENAINVFEQI